MQKCLLVHTETEEQSPNMYLLLEVYFFACQNNEEFLMRGLLEHKSAIPNCVIFVTSMQQYASQSWLLCVLLKLL